MAVKKLEIHQAEMARLFGPSGEVARDLERRGDVVADSQKRRAAVDTGRMRDSVTRSNAEADQIGVQVDIGPTATANGFPYPMAVEFGTSTRPAQPFIRPSLEDMPRT
jgi:HK97 gp10 family phage protein